MRDIKYTIQGAKGSFGFTPRIKNSVVWGFTLVELLVVISIIGILAALALVSFTGAQKQARDTQRKSDLKQYATALENFSNKHESLFPSGVSPGGYQIASDTFCTFIGLQNCSEDPKYDSDDPIYSLWYYKYSSNDSFGQPFTDVNASEYVLWSFLEAQNGNTMWVYCSNGQTGEVSEDTHIDGTSCPL